MNNFNALIAKVKEKKKKNAKPWSSRCTVPSRTEASRGVTFNFQWTISRSGYAFSLQKTYAVYVREFAVQIMLPSQTQLIGEPGGLGWPQGRWEDAQLTLFQLPLRACWVCNRDEFPAVSSVQWACYWLVVDMILRNRVREKPATSSKLAGGIEKKRKRKKQL